MSNFNLKISKKTRLPYPTPSTVVYLYNISGYIFFIWYMAIQSKKNYILFFKKMIILTKK